MDINFDESVYSEMWKSKLQWSLKRMNLASKANKVILAINLLVEVYLRGFFSNFGHKVLLLVLYGNFFLFIEWAKRSPMKTALFSFIHGELTTISLLFYAFYNDPAHCVAYATLNTLILIFFQSYLFMSITSIILATSKYFCYWVAFGYYSGFFPEALDSSTIPTIFSIPIYLGLCMYFEYLQDLSVYKAKKDVEYSMSKIELIVGAIPDGIIILDHHLNIVLSNSVMNEISGYQDTIVYLKDLQYYSKTDNDTTYILDDISKAFNEELDSELSLGLTKKNEKIIEWKGRVVKWDEKNCVILYARDVTRIIRLENESKENVYKSMLLRTVSHELRTPTNAMLSISELMMDEPQISTENKERLEIINCSCNYLLCLINDLLDYSQIVAGCLNVSSVKFDLNRLIEECCKLIQIQLRNRPVELKVIKGQIPTWIVSDPNRLKQIILNLLGNSVKFTLLGSITLKITYIMNQLKFEICDTGVGIPADQISTLFRQFGKLEQTIVLNPQGAGLGLFISNMLTYKLGGSGIYVSSELGSGSCFSFVLKLEEIQNEKNIEKKLILSKKNSKKFSVEGVKILIVDDTAFNVLAIQQVLEKEGFKTEYSSNGKDAIEKIRAKEYDLVLMDCEMPIMDGWETTKSLKNLRLIENLPIIIGHTSHNYDNIVEKCKEVGMDDVIIKPCPRDELLKRLKKWVKSRSKL